MLAAMCRPYLSIHLNDSTMFHNHHYPYSKCVSAGNANGELHRCCDFSSSSSSHCAGIKYADCNICGFIKGLGAEPGASVTL